ncbi:Rieske 2Fe-2S domain-containing protein [Caldiplasma sukawensis]
MTWHKIVGIKAVENAGGHVSVKVGDNVIFIVKDKDGLHAIDGVCTHARCILGEYNEDSKEVKCPCHSAVFDLKTGKMLKPPTVAPNTPLEKNVLKHYGIRESNGFVELETAD